MENPQQFTGATPLDARARLPLRALLLLALLASMLAASTPARQDFQANEYEIKAAYLLNFPNFVEWPGSGNANASSPIRVCLLGSDPLGTSLARMMADRLPQGKSLLLQRLARTEPVADCQILYISPSEGKYIPQILDALHGASVLTVGENDQFAAQGGMIQLVIEEDRIRFKINPTAASQAGIHISSKLLALAQIVAPAHPNPDGKHQASLKEESLKNWRLRAPYCWTLKRTGSINMTLPT